MKKFIFIFLSIFLTFQLSSFTKENDSVLIYFFWGRGCPHCEREKLFLNKLQKKYPNVQIYQFEVWENKKNDELLKKVGKKLNINILSIPVTIVGDKYFIGFLDANTTGKNIENALIEAIEYGSFDVVKSVMDEKDDKFIEDDKKYQIPDTIKIPFFGQIKIKNISLPLLTIILGAIDGFNPCAMWALLMLISFLIAVHNRKKMCFLGFLFIFASAFVYFLFMVAWLNFLLFFAYVKWIKIAIGLIAILGGAYYLKEFCLNKNALCKVTSSKFKQKVSTKIALLTEKKGLFLAAVGIIILAFLVNLIELVCSASLPVIYTQILSISSLTPTSYYLYILLYIFVFMLDDLIVFSIAMISLHLMKLTTKYSRFSHLIGSVILLILGVLLIFKPEFLMF